MSSIIPTGKDYVGLLMSRTLKSLSLDDPPTHTIPPWNHTPGRQRGSAPIAALRIQKQNDLLQRGCHLIQDANDWHVNTPGNYWCKKGIVILSRWKATVPIVVIDRLGSGCNNSTPRCNRKYVIPFELEEGANVLNWCGELGIQTSRTALVRGIQDIPAAGSGPFLYLPQSEYLTYERYDQNRDPEKAELYSLFNTPDVMGSMSGYAVQPEVQDFWIPKDYPTNRPEMDPNSVLVLAHKHMVSRITSPEWLRKTLNDSEGLRHAKWHFSMLDHKMMSRHITPPRCLCGDLGASRGKWMDAEHLEFRPSPYLMKLLSYAPHQVVDEYEQVCYTLNRGVIRVDIRKPLTVPVAYIKLQDPSEEEDNGQESSDTEGERTQGVHSTSQGGGRDGEGPTMADLESSDGEEREEAEEDEEAGGQEEEQEDMGEEEEEQQMEHSGDNEAGVADQIGASTSAKSLVCPEYGSDGSEDDS